jgi:hypothetical protein
LPCDIDRTVEFQRDRGEVIRKKPLTEIAVDEWSSLLRLLYDPEVKAILGAKLAQSLSALAHEEDMAPGG